MDNYGSLGDDMQSRSPSASVELTRVGITSLKRVLRLSGADRARRPALFFAEMDLFARLDAARAGIHMSRLVENIEIAAAEASSETAPDIETFAERVALAVARTQGALRSEVRIRARFPMTKRTPATHTQCEDIYTFIGIAVSDAERARRAVGVCVEGYTVCPCANEMASESARRTLIENGISEAEARRIVSLLPIASHSQRGRGTLIVGTQTHVRAESLVKVVESSMSSEIYELLKRPDELAVIEKGHSEPRFVEDVVREMIKNTARMEPHLPDDTFVAATQENFESIHSHNALAERCGYLGGMRRELAGERPQRVGPSSLESWLEGLLSR